MTWTGVIDQENCDAVAEVKDDENVIYTERLHFPGEYGLTACFDSRMYACLVGSRNDKSVVEAASKGGKQTFKNSKGQTCYFEKFDVYFGNMGCFSQHPDFLSYMNLKVSCEETSSIPLYCAKSEKMARQVLLAREELACKEKDGAFEGDVYPFGRVDGSMEYCVSASCDICDTRWRDDYMNRWKMDECCKARNKEPNLNNGTCMAPLPPGPEKIGVNYSKITALPGCSEKDAGEGENFCEVPKSSSSESSSSMSSSSISSSSVPSSSSFESSSSGLSSSSSEKQEPAKCFPSDDEADVALLDVRVTCESKGGVPNYSLDEYNCLVGDCSMPSSSSRAKSSSSVSSSSFSSSSVSSSSISSSSRTSSSSMGASSSSKVQSSSSDAFVAGADQVYAPGQIFRSGLQNMEPGACYSLNPDRGTIYGWNISYDASDTWWWQKVDCETGEKAVGNGIGACSAYPESVPSNVSGCYSYNGSCYICDKSKGDYVDCNADWLWKNNFPYHDWFKQVDCYDPYEEGEFFSEQCNVSNALYKKSNQRAVYIKETYLNPSIIKNEYYDVLGRKDNKKTKFIKLYNLDFSPLRIKTAQTTYRGHVNADIEIGWELNCEFPPVEKDGGKEYFYNAYMRIVVYEPEYENDALKEHEERHRELYRNPNVSNVQLDNMSVKVPKGTRKKDVCLNIVASFWNVMELKLNSMFNAQNQIDYNDNQDHLSYPSVQDSVEKYHNLQLRKCYSK